MFDIFVCHCISTVSFIARLFSKTKFVGMLSSVKMVSPMSLTGSHDSMICMPGDISSF